MGVWLQREAGANVEPAVSPRLAVALLGADDLEQVEPLLSTNLPAVDGLLLPRTFGKARSLPVPVETVHPLPSGQDLAAGRLPSAFLEYDQVLWLRPGEVLLGAHEAPIFRRAATQVNGTAHLPVHYAFRDGLTLLCLEPRWLMTQQPMTLTPGFVGVPIESSRPPAEVPPAPQDGLASALLHRAVRALVTGQTAFGFEVLEYLYGQTAQQSRTITALVVRNALLAALAAGDAHLADTWLGRARTGPDHPEVGLACALAPLLRGDPAAAVEQLTALLPEVGAPEPPVWVGGGGEGSYRLLTFRGKAFAAMGNLRAALEDWGRALQINPDYAAPLDLIARQRVHPAVLDDLGLAAHRKGRLRTVTRLVKHAYAQAERLAAPARSKAPGRSRPGVRWEGPFFTHASLARVNRELAAELLASGWDLGAVPTEPPDHDPTGGAPRWQALWQRQWHQPARTAVTIRHHWPPKLESTGSGRQVVYLPWEYGAIPEEWLPGLHAVDEVWAYSDWVRQGIVAAGIAPDRVRVIPCGFDPEVFHPGEGPQGAFRLLYVGGTIARKGYDIALEAFLREFAPDEPATLTVKDFGSATFYRGMSGSAAVRAAAEATARDRRRVILLDAVLDDADLAALYRSAHCLVAPYRAEGFCLPALEAMACGTPAILPRFGPALDYAPTETALWVEAGAAPGEPWVAGMPLRGNAVTANPPVDDVRRAMRWAYRHPAELRAMGRAAAEHVLSGHTWAACARTAAGRLELLCGYQ